MEDPELEEAKRAATAELEDLDIPSIVRFGKSIRKRNSCPLCNFVQTEVEKGHEFPVEEWIYLSHLRCVHKLDP